MGAVLAEPRTAEEDTAIAELADDHYWIGLTTHVAKVGPWTWQSDGTTAEWYNWHPDGQPNDSNGYCVYINLDLLSKWRDLSCVIYQNAYVCQTAGR